MKKLLIFTLSLIPLFMAGCRNNQATHLASPNGSIVFYPVDTSDGSIQYTVSANGYVVVEPSPLGLTGQANMQVEIEPLSGFVGWVTIR